MYWKKGGEGDVKYVRNEKHRVTMLVVAPLPRMRDCIRASAQHFQLFFFFFHPNMFILRLMEVGTLVSLLGPSSKFLPFFQTWFNARCFLLLLLLSSFFFRIIANLSRYPAKVLGYCRPRFLSKTSGKLLGTFFGQTKFVKLR